MKKYRSWLGVVLLTLGPVTPARARISEAPKEADRVVFEFEKQPRHQAQLADSGVVLTRNQRTSLQNFFHQSKTVAQKLVALDMICNRIEPIVPQDMIDSQTGPMLSDPNPPVQDRALNSMSWAAGDPKQIERYAQPTLKLAKSDQTAVREQAVRTMCRS